MFAVHVARRGARTGSSSDRVVAGDGLRAMYPALYKGNETTRKVVRVRNDILFSLSSSSRVCPVIALRRSLAFQQQELDGHRRFQHVASELRCVCSIVGPLAHHENLLERNS